MFNIGKLEVGGKKTIVIAEAGVNHLKNHSIAEKLIKTASEAGADILKFQTYSASKLTTRNAPRFWEWSGEKNSSGSQHDSYKILETPQKSFTKFLIETCKKYNVEFMSTPFDDQAVDMLFELGCKAFKIASGDITNFPLLRKVSQKGLPIFLSTGASTISEIQSAIKTVKAVNQSINICVMHCTLCYPTRETDANLGAILDIKRHFPEFIIGLSDHSIGYEIPAASVLYGVKAIEKHYTFDNDLPDSADHWLSIDQRGLSEMCRLIRKFENSIGNKFKGLVKCEEITRAYARRSLVSNGPIKKGEKFTINNLIPKRPGFGISPDQIDKILGLTCKDDIADDVVIVPKHIVEDAPFKPITEDLLSLNKDV